MVLRKTEKVNFSGEEAVPYGVAVMRSCRRAQERLSSGLLAGNGELLSTRDRED